MEVQTFFLDIRNTDAGIGAVEAVHPDLPYRRRQLQLVVFPLPALQHPHVFMPSSASSVLLPAIFPFREPAAAQAARMERGIPASSRQR